VLIAARIIGEVSGKQQRHRLSRHGNRSLNAASRL
jgi:hypothetical protein